MRNTLTVSRQHRNTYSLDTLRVIHDEYGGNTPVVVEPSADWCPVLGGERPMNPPRPEQPPMTPPKPDERPSSPPPHKAPPEQTPASPPPETPQVPDPPSPDNAR